MVGYCGYVSRKTKKVLVMFYIGEIITSSTQEIVFFQTHYSVSSVLCIRVEYV